MKLYGDVPEEHKELAIALTQTEKVFDLSMDTDRSKLAKGYVCLSHDWYHIGMEEEGLRLLSKAEQVYPGYFKTMIAKHCYEDADFEFIVRNMTAELVRMMLSRLEDRKQ